MTLKFIDKIGNTKQKEILGHNWITESSELIEQNLNVIIHEYACSYFVNNVFSYEKSKYCSLALTVFPTVLGVSITYKI